MGFLKHNGCTKWMGGKDAEHKIYSPGTVPLGLPSDKIFSAVSRLMKIKTGSSVVISNMSNEPTQ